MLSSEIRKRFDSCDNQLSLNLTHNSSTLSTERIADSVYSITSGKIAFHPEKSEI